MKIAVTGATGHLGGKVVAELSKKTSKNDIVALVHNKVHAKNLIEQNYEIREIDFQNEISLYKAFSGIDTLIYVASKTYSVFDRVHELENVLAAMKEKHVGNLVAMSFIADQEDNPFVMSPFYGYLPRRLAGTDLNYAIAKNSLYADPLVPYLPELIERKGLIYPVGKQAMSFITLDDSAEAMATMALNREILKSRKSYLLTQSRSYTMPELGAVMTEVTSHEIGYHPVTVEEFGKIYVAEGDGTELASMYKGGAMGYLHGLSDDFAHITGHEPETMEHFLSREYKKQ
ncbi:NAD(P)H-binding protein [Lactobacillus ultunensis]|uniref:NmrA family protein n=1 Tax=Lactobacillus ultunensis DSM 16047 TaxID=525365 RepID=C2ENA8_9LACO|nr:NAD(P)H-binding protein [Lactobacillus ultunensis]EEJ71912.1 NmrA family protein [Lactobacillus ultunensis DSM 16047]KRL82090.1 nucleoside-diphosphate-sugar epimerase [Lactobacillus ultunensis DSM 16047]QQP27673.1 NAD(P)H-binding protein [Lactobacillus ultunensis]